MHINYKFLICFLIVALIIFGAIFSIKLSDDLSSNPNKSTKQKNLSKQDTGQFSTRPSWIQNFATMPNGALSSAYWRYDLGTGGPTDQNWGNDEAEYYTDNPDNVGIYNGLLTITARKQTYDGQQYTSARIKTQDLVDFEYGKIDVVAKLPSGIGTWPAIWLLPQNNIYYYNSPNTDPLQYLNDGEIDIMESIGAQPGIVTSSAQSRVYNQILNTERIGTYTISNDTTTFHDYGLEWTPDQLIFTIDGNEYHTVNREPTDTYKQWPYDQPYYLIINLALGGTYGGLDTNQYPPDGIDDTQLPTSMQISSVSYYKYDN
jgi:beta-glucanase (GH16 family)